MLKRILFSSAAIAIMMGCSSDDIFKEVTSAGDIPVNISYKSSRALSFDNEGYTAKGTVKDGETVIKTDDLNIDADGIDGIIEDVVGDDELKVVIEVFDANGNLKYTGVDYVTLEDDEYETVHTNLYEVDLDGKILVDSTIIEDNGAEDVVIELEEVKEILSILAEELDVDAELLDALVKLASTKEWSSNDLLLIELFVDMLIEGTMDQDEYIEWEEDTIFIDDTLDWEKDKWCDDSLWINDSLIWGDTTWVEDTLNFDDTIFIDDSMWVNDSIIDDGKWDQDTTDWNDDKKDSTIIDDGNWDKDTTDWNGDWKDSTTIDDGTWEQDITDGNNSDIKEEEVTDLDSTGWMKR